MKKLLAILITTLALWQVSYCQDIIHFKNGNARKVYVLTTSETEMTCRDVETKEIFTILKNLVDSVKYQSGKVEPLGAAMPQFASYKAGILHYRGIDYTRPKTIKSVLLQNPDLEITDQFHAYRTKRTLGQVFTLLSGFSLGWNIGGAVSGEKIDGKLLVGTVSSLIVGLILDKASNKNLKSAIDIYNDNLSNNTFSFKPMMNQDLNFQTYIGFRFQF
jgi:hypothetical protein